MSGAALALAISCLGGLWLAIAAFGIVYWLKGRKRRPPSEPVWDFAKQKPLPTNTSDTVTFRRSMPYAWKPVADYQGALPDGQDSVGSHYGGSVRGGNGDAS